MSIRTLALFAALMILSFARSSEPRSPVLDSESDAQLDFSQLATKYGHPAEEYVIYTDDGYTLKVFHLPGKGTGLPVLLFHGLTESSDTWIIRGNSSLAITLATAGHDVWLGNVRGNRNSVGPHFVPSDPKRYWNFTFHEHGTYDLPTTIDFVLNETGAAKLNAIGHSQGTAIFFVLLSSKPEYNEKVNLFIALAPIAFLHHTPLNVKSVFASMPALYDTLGAVGKFDIFGRSSPELVVTQALCRIPLIAFYICLNIVTYSLTGSDPTEIEPAFSPVVFGHFPTASTTKNILHYSQVISRESFARFDYGPERNLMVYNSETPPDYPLRNVKTKVVLVSARNDFLSTQADVALLRRRLPNVVRNVICPRPIMNHVDFTWGRNTAKYLYPYIFDSLRRYG